MLARRVLPGLLLVLACGDNSSPGDWQRVEDAALDGVNFRAAWGLGDQVWAVGMIYDLEQAAVVHFDGESWDVLPVFRSYPSFPIRSVWATSPDDVWLAAGRLAHWNGNSWRTSDPLGHDRRFTHIWGTSDEDMWAIVEMDPLGHDVEVARSRGSGWAVVQAIPLDHTGYGSTVGCSNGSDDVWIAGLVSGDLEDPTFGASVVHWDGTSWTSHGVPGYDTSVVQLFCTGHSVVVVTGGGENLLLRWTGQDWDQTGRNEERNAYESVWATDSGDGWVGGAQFLEDDRGVPQIWRHETGVLTPTIDPELGLPGYRADLVDVDVRAIWATSSGRTFAFGPGGLVHEYVGPR